MSIVNKTDKAQTKMLTLIAEHLMKSGHSQSAIQVYRKMGDVRLLALAFVQALQWPEVRANVHEQNSFCIFVF